jgi:molybdate transport system ATP-binding protein
VLELQLHLQRDSGFSLELNVRLPALGTTVLFGPSGCGKSTVLRALAGLEREARARVALNGEVWQDGTQFLPPQQRGVGLVFQDAALFPHLTVRRNLDYGQARIPRGQAKPEFDEAIALLGIEALLEREPESLSGGERQRVAIARALAMAPRLLLLDEPLASLDAPRRADILPYLDRLRAELTLPMVYVTHSVQELTRLADEVLLLQAGRVQAQGPLAEMLLHPLLTPDDEAGVVLSCHVAERDAEWHLARLDFDGGALRVRDDGYAVGQPLRLRVLARDVSLARQMPEASSISNVLQGVLESLESDTHPATQLACVRVGAARLLARLTRHSVHRLQLAVGEPVWVQLKSVAVLR